MALEITYSNDSYPKGEVIEIAGLALKNKETIKLSDEQEVEFTARNGSKVRDFLKGDKAIKVSGTTEVTE